MGSFTLAQVAARTDVLAVACSRCERAERYPLATLIDRYGGIFTVPLLLDELLKGLPETGLRSLRLVLSRIAGAVH
jgi:hypothetical protein